MQDRFKLRVWDTLANKMTYNFMLGNFMQKSQTDYEKKDWVGINYEPDYICFNNEGIDYLVLMQPTGLRDKNGKLIYEGDIVNVYVSSEKLYRYQVKFEIGSFMLVSDGEIFDFPNKWNDNVYPLSQLYFEYDNEENCIDQLEVIGNVYENPELLGVENE